MKLTLKQRYMLFRTESIIRKLGKQLNVAYDKRAFQLNYSDLKNVSCKNIVKTYTSLIGKTNLLYPVIKVGKFTFELDSIIHGGSQQEILLKVDKIIIAERDLERGSRLKFRHKVPTQMLIELCDTLELLKQITKRVKYDNKYNKTNAQLELEREQQLLIEKFGGK